MKTELRALPMFSCLLVAILLVCSLTSGVENSEARREWGSTPEGLDIQGHRGCRGLLPENSIAAFEKGLALRVTTLELDLQATKDRVLVVHHDQHLDPKRCIYDDGRKVPKKLFKDLLHKELANIDCGRLPHPRFPTQQRVPGTRIPRLEEVLALAQGADYPVRLNIEIKMQKPKNGIPVREFAELLVTLIKRYGLEERTVVQSFYPPALLAVRELDPDIPRAMLVIKRRNYDRLLGESEGTILAPRFQRLRLEDVKRFQGQDIPVVPWTVNKPTDIRRLIRWGVDGIISDYPDRVIKIYETNLAED